MLSWCQFSEITDSVPLDTIYSRATTYYAENNVELGLEWVDRYALQSKTDGQLDSLAYLYFSYGYLCRLEKNYKQSHTLYYKALRIAHRLDDVDLQYQLTMNIAKVYELLNDWRNAELTRIELIHLADYLDNDNYRIRATYDLGLARKELHQFDSAMLLFERSHNLAKEMDHKNWQALNLIELGICEYELGRYEESIDYYNNAEGINPTSKIRAMCANNRGNALISLNKSDEALLELTDAASIKDNLGSSELRITTLNNLGKVYFGKGEYERSLEYLKTAFFMNNIDGFNGSNLQSFLLSHDYMDSIEIALGDKHLLEDIGVDDRYKSVTKDILHQTMVLHREAKILNADLVKERIDRNNERYYYRLIILIISIVSFLACCFLGWKWYEYRKLNEMHETAKEELASEILEMENS